MTSQNDRINRLKLLLSKQRDYMTAIELAELMETSTKTIYRLVKKINEEYADGSLILSEKGRGYQLDYGKYLEQIEPTMKSVMEISPSERQAQVMEQLLLSSPKAIKILDLFKDFYVGDSAIANDEKMIASQVERFELKLFRKNRTLAIKGKEVNIRRAIAELIQRLNIIDLDDMKTANELNFNRYDVLFVSDQLKIVEQALGGEIPYPYNVNVFSHLYIMICRSRQTRQQLVEEQLTKEQRQLLDANQEIKDIATKVIKNVEGYLVTKLPVSEIYYLYQYLLSSRMKKQPDKKPTFSPEVEQITNYYLREVGKKLNIKLTDSAIFVDLSNHIKPMLNRLKHQIHVKNGLLDQIQLTYERIYKDVIAVSVKVSETFNLPPINQDENGFITLYFARMIETYQVPIQTLTMCTTGVGTSELSKAKIVKKFPELAIIDVIATKNYRSVLDKAPGIELILTTVGLKNSLPVHSLLVSAMLTANDQLKIRKKIEEIYHER